MPLVATDSDLSLINTVVLSTASRGISPTDRQGRNYVYPVLPPHTTDSFICTGSIVTLRNSCQVQDNGTIYVLCCD